MGNAGAASLLGISVGTGEVRKLSELEGGWFLHELGLSAWSPDSRSIYFALRGKGRVLRVPAEGGEAADTGLIRGVWSDSFSEEELDSYRIRGISTSPDGKQISFSVEKKSEFGLWAMKGFLPKLRAAQ